MINQPVEVKIHLNKFKPRDYQKPIFKAFFEDHFKRLVICMCRRAGKDLCTWNIAIREAITHPGVYYLVYPTYAQGKKILWSSMTIQGERFLDYIPRQIIEGINSQEMKVTLTNGSIIQIIGSDNPDRIVGTNPRGVVFSEYALQNPRIYALMAPILAANGGWAIFQSCVSPETLVLSETGFKRIKDISDNRTEYSDLNKNIYGLGGFNNATDFYYGGVQNTLKITLTSGFSIECTPIHPLWDGSRWVKAKDIKLGDLFPVQYGQNIFGPGLDISGFNNSEHSAALRLITKDSLTDNFFYLLGLIHADGNYGHNQITITNKKDPEIKEFIKQYGFVTQKDGIHHQVSSINLVSFLEFIGFKHGAKTKLFPEKLFTCTKSQLRSFIQGLFDGDGTSNSNPSKRVCIKFTSTCVSFIKDLQVILLNFGIVSSIRKEEKDPTLKVPVASTIYNLEITGYFAHIFYEEIGFRLSRKQKNKMYLPDNLKEESGNIYPVDVSKLSFKPPKHTITNPNMISRRMIIQLIEKYNCEYLKSLISELLFFAPVASIEVSSSDVFDFVIPSTHSFFSGGFLSHNTPRGKNHFWDLYQLASNSPQWWTCKLGLDETKHIDPKEIDREVAEGLMSPDLVQQEYFCSFSAGVEGAYYCKYIDRLRLNNQIGSVPWESGFNVHTAWDIGVRDSTTIIFFQTIGQTIRIIDYYEKNKEGLEHYVKHVLSKEYTYGKHIAPHDIEVKEFGSGFTRIEKARQLGINFIVAPKTSIMDGIETVRSTLSKVWIDEEKCSKLIKALENYRQEYDQKRQVYKEQPLHDMWSHACFTGSMKVLTTRGYIPIQDVSRGDYVITPLGVRRVLATHKRTVSTLCLINNSIECTPQHLIFTNTGLISADTVRYGHMLEPYSRCRNFLWKKIFGLFFKEQDIVGFKKIILFQKMGTGLCLMDSFIDGMHRNTTWDRVTQEKRFIQRYKGIFGKNIMVKFLKGTLCIIKMVIHAIIPLKILNYLRSMNMGINMQRARTHGANLKNAKTCFVYKTTKLKSGIEVKKEENGTKIMPNILYRDLVELNTKDNVNFVITNSNRDVLGENSVVVNAKQEAESSNVSIMKKGFVLFAVKVLSVINMFSKKHVVKNVQFSVHDTPKEVYDLTIETDNCYYVNGYLVSNSDAFRYLCVSLPRTRDGLSANDLDKIHQEALYGSDSMMPNFFKDKYNPF